MKNNFWGLFVVFCLTVTISCPVASQGASPDARILILDLDYYSSIVNQSDRFRAIDDMFADVAMFEEAAPAKGETIVLVPHGANVRSLVQIGPGQSFKEAVSGNRAMAAVRDGTYRDGPILDLNDVRPAVFTALNGLGLNKVPRGGGRHVLDVHVFAPGWRISRNDNTGDLMGTLQATECIIARGPQYSVWPKTVDVRFEFRVPERIEKPSASALAAFIGVLTGYSTKESFIFSRGATGPLCDLDTSVLAEGYIHPARVNDLDCNNDTVQRFTVSDLTNACRRLAPLVPSIGSGLDRGPVSLISRPEKPEISRATLTGSLTGLAQIVARIGGVEIRISLAAGSAPVQLAAPGWFVLQSRAGCRPGQGGKIILSSGPGSGPGSVEGTVSRYYCRESELELGLVALK